jgi:hypothetical protein
VVELQAELADARHHFELRFKAAAVEAEADRRRAVDLAEARVRCVSILIICSLLHMSFFLV